MTTHNPNHNPFDHPAVNPGNHVDAIFAALVSGLNHPASRIGCARRLLGNYSYDQLGQTLYQRCRRALMPASERKDPVRYKVAGSRPGRLSGLLLADYEHRSRVANIARCLDEDKDETERIRKLEEGAERALSAGLVRAGRRKYGAEGGGRGRSRRSG